MGGDHVAAHVPPEPRAEAAADAGLAGQMEHHVGAVHVSGEGVRRQVAAGEGEVVPLAQARDPAALVGDRREGGEGVEPQHAPSVAQQPLREL